jgi:hypothetical protein
VGVSDIELLSCFRFGGDWTAIVVAEIDEPDA